MPGLLYDLHISLGGTLYTCTIAIGVLLNTYTNVVL